MVHFSTRKRRVLLRAKSQGPDVTPCWIALAEVEFP